MKVALYEKHVILSKNVNDCPCQYNAKPSITTKVMDITMCCLVINTICTGLNVADVNTIREIRNKLIHAASGHLDQLTFSDYWNKVKTALLNLASHVSPSVHTDTLDLIDELDDLVMNPDVLGKIRDVVMDEKRINELEVSVSDLTVTAYQTNSQLAHNTASLRQATDKVTTISTCVDETTEKVVQLEDKMTQNVDQNQRKISRLETAVDYSEQILRDYGIQIDDHDKQIDDHGRQFQIQERRLQSQQKAISNMQQKMEGGKTPRKSLTFFKRLFRQDKTGIKKLRKTLMKINNDLTKSIQLSPLQERGEDELPIELLFASVVIHEDHKYHEKGRTSVTQNREVRDIADLFEKDGKEVRKIYMLGDAAHGKTTYCLWLLRNWCNVKNKDRIKSKDLEMCDNAMKNFDFVFLVKLRNADPHLASVVDMICEDLFRDNTDYHTAVRHVLSSDKYRSLIILDGLDEWNPNEETRKQLTCQGIPNIRVSSTVSCFVSMRPWVFSLITKIVKTCDRVIEILGLSKSGMKNVIKNVLLHHYKLKSDKLKYIEKYNKIIQNLKDESLNSFMQIPLLAVVCVQIWYEGKQVGDSMTSFYAEMLNMLIERASEKTNLYERQDKSIDSEVPEILSAHEKIKNHFYVLLKLGKVSYEGLISNEINLVFQKSKLENEIGVRELKFLLDVGLISKMEARSLTTKHVSVRFFHKSLQEFLAVIYIVTNKAVGDSFCNHLSNIKVVLELSNVVMFICGMCPSIGSVISQHVLSLTDSDEGICEYRRSPSCYNSTVKEMYHVQVSWYRELSYGQTDSRVTFHISDLYLSDHSDIETVRVTKKLLSDHHIEIRSLVLMGVPSDKECGITNEQLFDFACNKHNNTSSLDMVCINGHNTSRIIYPICIQKLRCLYLYCVKINNAHPYRTSYRWRRDILIRTLQLDRVTLGYGGLDLSNMTSLRDLRLTKVKLGKRGLDLSCMTSLRVLQLEWVTLGDRGLDLSNVTSLYELRLECVAIGHKCNWLNLSNMTSLRVVMLEWVSLDYQGVLLSACMAQIEKVGLKYINMSATQWKQFILSVLEIMHRFDVELQYTNIDDESKKRILMSPDVRVTRDYEDECGRYDIYFTRV